MRVGKRGKTRKKGRTTRIGRQILVALQEIVDALKSGEPLEKRFTVREVEVPDSVVRSWKKDVKRRRRRRSSGANRG